MRQEKHDPILLHDKIPLSGYHLYRLIENELSEQHYAYYEDAAK